MPLATAKAVITQCPGRRHPQIARDGRQRDIGNGGIQHLHEGAQRQHQRGDRQGATRHCALRPLGLGSACALPGALTGVGPRHSQPEYGDQRIGRGRRVPPTSARVTPAPMREVTIGPEVSLTLTLTLTDSPTRKG